LPILNSVVKARAQRPAPQRLDSLWLRGDGGAALQQPGACYKGSRGARDPKVVAEIAGALTEEKIGEKCFDLIFAFDEARARHRILPCFE
jgi:hypothetical protein